MKRNYSKRHFNRLVLKKLQTFQNESESETDNISEAGDVHAQSVSNISFCNVPKNEVFESSYENNTGLSDEICAISTYSGDHEYNPHDLSEKLAQWITVERIPRNAANKPLTILSESGVTGLPRCSESLVQRALYKIDIKADEPG